MSENDAAMPSDELGDPTDLPTAPHTRRFAALTLGWLLLLPSAVHLSTNPSALGPLWSTSTALACVGLLVGVTLVAWTRSTRAVDTGSTA